MAYRCYYGMCIVLALSTALFSLVSAADSSTLEHDEMVWGPRFDGFEGIIFMCAYDMNASLVAETCERAETEIELLAAGNNVPLIIVEPNKWFQLARHGSLNSAYVALEYSLQAVEDSGGQMAMSGRLQFNVFYSNAVEQDSQPGDFGAKPRPGDLVIWEDSLIGIGSRSGFVEGFSSAAEQTLKKGFTLFLKHADPANRLNEGSQE